jgi:2-polyprenyl-3-methyl-5-hydroxy-6-metoxy-1,4-benzoquinol methylase
MKAYQEVVRERYEGREKSIHIYDNQYSLINPIGFYASTKIRETFYKIFNRLRKDGIGITLQKILDVGCGGGDWTRYFAELIGSTENIAGIDLSSHRIERAKKLNPGIRYYLGDIVNLSYSKEFNIITAIDVFSHLNTEDEHAQ